MGQAPYRYLPEDFAEHYASVVTTPYQELVEAGGMYESLHFYVEELLHTARSGLRRGRGQRAQPVVLRHVAQSGSGRGDRRPRDDGRRVDTAICVVGRSLGKAREPLKVAEEYAMLDVLSGGR